jgi:predicted RND superfamily exporter protein
LNRPSLVGPPVLLADGFTAIEQDGRRLAVAGMLLIALVTLAATGSPWWALVPILCGWTVWLAAEHVLAGLNLKLALSGGPIVAQIIVLTMPAASHLAIHFRDHLRRHPDRAEAARETLAAVSRPIAWCAVTGAVGYAALVTSNVVPVRQFGAVLAVCTLAASGLTLAVSPMAMRPPVRLERPVRPGTRSRSGNAVDRLIATVARRPLVVVIVMGGVALALASGIPRLRYESNYVHAFRSDSRVVRDYNFIESRLGGIGLISVVVPVPEGPPTTATLAKFEDLRREIEQTTPGETVTSVLSLSRVLDPEGRIAALGEKAADRALGTKLELIDASPQGALLGSFWNREKNFARVLVRLPEQQPAPIKERTFARSLAAARAGFGAESSLTGLSYLLTQTTRGVMATSWSTFAWAMAGILVMLVLAYRSVSLAMLALLPSLLAVGLVIGLMGWIGMKLDLATALVSSVALGLSVDDTFHCLLQYRRHRERGGSPARALRASFAVSGPGVLLSSLAVAMGFAVLWFSPFAPFRNFGVMVGIATLGSSIGNLVLLPAFLAMGAGAGRGRADRRVSRLPAVPAGPGGS